MAISRNSGKTGSRRRKFQSVIQKPRGTFHPRVQKVGPEHFGIVCVDCAKERSKFLVTDFYGNILIAPTPVEHNRPGLEAAIVQIRAVFAEHDNGRRKGDIVRFRDFSMMKNVRCPLFVVCKQRRPAIDRPAASVAQRTYCGTTSQRCFAKFF
jgi:hypothetical protein